LRKFDPGRVLGASAVVAALLVTATILLGGSAAMATILAVGLFNSSRFPTIFTLGIEGLVFGWLADGIGVHRAFVLPALCYLYIVHFGWRRAAQPAAIG
jgi:FHS family L-fucose permease-like MFS transporter